MFSKADINTIDLEYFEVLDQSAFQVTLRSKNTGHEWHILSQEIRLKKSDAVVETCTIGHRHHASDPFHEQTHVKDLNKAQEFIKDHDRFHLDKRKNRSSKHSR